MFFSKAKSTTSYFLGHTYIYQYYNVIVGPKLKKSEVCSKWLMPNNLYSYFWTNLGPIVTFNIVNLE